MVLHLIGYHCYTGTGSGVQVVKVDSSEFVANWNIWQASDDYLKGNYLTIAEAHPESKGKESRCYTYAKYNTSQYYYFWQACNEENPEPECQYVLKTYSDCNNCTVKESCLQSGIAELIFGLVTCSEVAICEPNESATGLYEIPSHCGLPLKDRFEAFPDYCWIPTYYRWNTSTGLYDCTDLSICGDDAEYVINKRANQLLESVGYELAYPTLASNQNIDNAIYLKCDNNLNPELTVFGLPIFNYRVWVLIFIIGITGSFLFALGKQHK
jgi:hypothetical protein